MLDTDAGPVAGDPGRLQQVAWNLLSNAVKFTPRGGSVEVSLKRVERDVEFAVRDTGRGIEPAFLPHVFDRFRQADAGTTRVYGGLGLGLAIVRHLVELHGGTVHAHSEGPGTGATFTVTFPLSQARAREDGTAAKPSADAQHRAAANPDDAPKSPLSGVRVLVVEDDADARTLIDRILQNAGAQVTTASSAPQAVERFQQSRPDILVSDIGMPEEDGYTLIARLRALEPDGMHVPAVALTALARPDDRRRALAAGYQVHVPKPVEPAELTAVVVKLARGHRDLT
jgi:CheY-like chemotaxis protein